jgi:S-adenosylmethionine:tRNA ribosyltransferase-isomerase
MVATSGTSPIRHTVFSRVGDNLGPGDLLVVNVSATIPASLEGRTEDGAPIRLHVSSPVAGNLWTVEPRRPTGIGSERMIDCDVGSVDLPGGARALLLTPDSRSPRLWITQVHGVDDLLAYLARHGQPIRYSHTAGAWPLADYQNVYARRPGSAEMPSAGRPFTTDLVTSLVAAGIQVAPVVLHAGVASFEEGERPDVERYEVPEVTAGIINQVKARGGRVIAVGTTSVRAMETVADSRGMVHPGSGSTDLVVEPTRGVRVVDGLITGWHDAGASHLDLVAAIAGPDLIERCYREADVHGYLRHEFGDSLLVARPR